MTHNKPICYAIKHKNNDVISKSRSGGMFTAITDYVLNNDGIVYGVVLNEKLEAVHIRSNNIDDRNRMRGSKYVQSKLGDTFRQIKKDLDDNLLVLFSGTSCQIGGLKKYLSNREYKNLICIDIVCHGVPSPKVWKDYLVWQEKHHHSKVVSANFRNKKYGWREHIETLQFINGKSIKSKIFTKLFYSNLILRPSCYNCPFKSINHPGDITIADYWGIENNVPEFDDNKGVSLVLVNNDKGIELLNKIKHILYIQETDITKSMQKPFISSCDRPKNRDEFWNYFNKNDFNLIAKKYAGYGFVNFFKKIGRYINRKTTILKSSSKL